MGARGGERLGARGLRRGRGWAPAVARHHHWAQRIAGVVGRPPATAPASRADRREARHRRRSRRPCRRRPAGAPGSAAPALHRPPHPKRAREGAMAAPWSARQGDLGPSRGAESEEARARLAALKAGLGEHVPEAIQCLDEGFAAATQFFVFPKAHWKRLRSTNRLERLHGEVKNAESEASEPTRIAPARCASSLRSLSKSPACGTTAATSTCLCCLHPKQKQHETSRG